MPTTAACPAYAYTPDSDAFVVARLRALADDLGMDLAADLPNFALAGNAYHGVGVPQCIRSGEQAAERILGKATADEA